MKDENEVKKGEVEFGEKGENREERRKEKINNKKNNMRKNRRKIGK